MENEKTKRIVYGIILIIIVGAFLYFYNKNTVEAPIILDDNEILDKTYIEGNKDDLISFSILPGTRVSGIRSYRGEIKGGYFFEGNILINVLDVNKKVLKKSNAMATTEWMTADGVKFEGNIDFTGLPAGLGYIEIHNDNASGLPEYDKSVLVPIIIEATQANTETYTYKNHGITLELPKGFIPKEIESADKSINIILPNSTLVYVPDVATWEKDFGFPKNKKYIRDQLIGDTTFTVYSYDDGMSYWFKRGNVGYFFRADIISDIQTFKFVGWN